MPRITEETRRRRAARAAGSDEWLSYQQVADARSVHPRTVRRWVREGLLPATRLGPSTIRIRSSDLERFGQPVGFPRTPDAA